MSWMLRHAVLPLVIAYAVFLFILLVGERSTRTSRVRRRGIRPPFIRTLAHVVSTAIAGYVAFGGLVGLYCVAQRDPRGCLAPALWEAGVLAVIAVSGILVLEATAAALKRGERGSSRQIGP